MKKYTIFFVILFSGTVLFYFINKKSLQKKEEITTLLTPPAKKFQSLQKGQIFKRNQKLQKRQLSNSLINNKKVIENTKPLSNFPHEIIGNYKLYKTLFVRKKSDISSTDIIYPLKSEYVITNIDGPKLENIYITEQNNEVILISKSIVLKGVKTDEVSEIIGKYDNLRIENSFNHLSYHKLNCNYKIEECLNLIHDINDSFQKEIASVDIVKSKPSKQ